MTAATPAEWVEALSMALMLCGSAGAVAIPLIDADLDPRPVARRVHQAVVDAGHTLNRATASVEKRARSAARRAALSAAVLLLLLSTPEATR